MNYFDELNNLLKEDQVFTLNNKEISTEDLYEFVRQYSTLFNQAVIERLQNGKTAISPFFSPDNIFRLAEIAVVTKINNNDTTEEINNV